MPRSRFLLPLLSAALLLAPTPSTLFDADRGSAAWARGSQGGSNGNGAGQSNAGGNGNGAGQGNAGGNGNGTGQSNAGGNGNGAGQSNAGGNGNGASQNNAGGNGNGTSQGDAGIANGRGNGPGQGNAVGSGNANGGAAVTPAVGRPRSQPPPAPVSPGPRQQASLETILASGLDAARLAVLQARGYRVLRRTAGVIELRIPAGTSVASARADLARLAPSSRTDANTYYYVDGGHPACELRDCGPVMIGWARIAPDSCTRDLLIGMIDTAVNVKHPALAGQDIEVVSLGPGSSRPVHGTAIASLLVGRPDSTTPGLLPEARLIAVDAFPPRPGGLADRTDAMSLIDAIGLLSRRGVSVINLSLSGPPNALLEEAIAAAAAKGVVLVAAAGNQGPGAEPSYPAAYPGVLAVTAIDSRARLYPRASRGDYVDFAAPGVEVWAAASIRGGRPMNGTSYAVPFVSAVAAVLKAALPAGGTADVEARLEAAAIDLGDPGRDPEFGWGLVQADVDCGVVAGVSADTSGHP